MDSARGKHQLVRCPDVGYFIGKLSFVFASDRTRGKGISFCIALVRYACVGIHISTRSIVAMPVRLPIPSAIDRHMMPGVRLGQPSGTRKCLSRRWGGGNRGSWSSSVVRPLAPRNAPGADSRTDYDEATTPIMKSNEMSEHVLPQARPRWSPVSETPRSRTSVSPRGMMMA